MASSTRRPVECQSFSVLWRRCFFGGNGFLSSSRLWHNLLKPFPAGSLLIPCCSWYHNHCVQADGNPTMVAPSGEGVAGPFLTRPSNSLSSHVVVAAVLKLKVMGLHCGLVFFTCLLTCVYDTLVNHIMDLYFLLVQQS